MAARLATSLAVLVCVLATAAPAGAMFDAPVARAPIGPVFPVAGPHEYGTETNGFGGVRDHGGHDVFADCGTPVLAARGGEVTRAEYDGPAGNYAVITAPDGTSQVYMHLRRAAAYGEGETVPDGARIGEVGRTGDADGCHLHFELWTAPGWYQGVAIDPLPALERWER